MIPNCRQRKFMVYLIRKLMEALKIIIVDDNVKYRESLADLITQVLKFEVIAQASDGEEFLQISNKLRPDIILMDLSMPKMDGFLAT
ncbi:MAG TPA: hypothetical protein DCQ31_00640, partial [Bacteroidales bacterium]|nr:hypothetical protein [Bacteroidales bacterium]